MEVKDRQRLYQALKLRLLFETVQGMLAVVHRSPFPILVGHLRSVVNRSLRDILYSQTTFVNAKG